MARRFLLKNAIGEVWDFSMGSTRGTFLSSVNGLGLEYEDEWGERSDGFFSPISRKGSRISVAGTIAFYEDPYTTYRKFIKYVESSSDLKLGYAPKEILYYARCYVSKVTKTEINKFGVLSCSVEFSLISPWGRENPTKLSIKPNSSPLHFPNQGEESDTTANITRFPTDSISGFTFSSEAVGSIDFDSVGDMDGAYELSFPGPVAGPVLTLYHFDGESSPPSARSVSGPTKIATIRLDRDISESETLEISTRPDSSYIRVVSADGVITDLTDSVDIDEDIFARPKYGTNRISIETDNTLETSATIRIYDYYRSV